MVRQKWSRCERATKSARRTTQRNTKLKRTKGYNGEEEKALGGSALVAENNKEKTSQLVQQFLVVNRGRKKN